MDFHHGIVSDVREKLNELTEKICLVRFDLNVYCDYLVHSSHNDIHMLGLVKKTISWPL